MAIRKVINGEAINLDNGGGGSITAADVGYDNTESGLTATNTQDAIDELKSDLTALDSYVTKNIISRSITLTENQYYTTDADGYAIVILPYTSNTTNKTAVIRIRKDGVVLGLTKEKADTGSSKVISNFIRKGCEVTFATDGNYTGVTGTFYPLD